MNGPALCRGDVPAATIVAAQDGDEAAFEAIVRRYRQSVFGIAYGMTRDAGRAEDLVQEVFLRLWRGLHAFQASRPLRPWLMKLARNACLNALARKSLPTVSVEACGDEPGVPEPAAPGPSALEAAEKRELLARLRDAIARLPRRYRDLVKLRHLEGLSHREIARRLRCPCGTVKVRLFRARERLRALLGSEDASERARSRAPRTVAALATS